MSSLNSSQERNARALEIAGEMVREVLRESPRGLFDLRVDAQTRTHRREEFAAEAADLTRKVAANIVGFI